jgi:hypothetical protein
MANNFYTQYTKHDLSLVCTIFLWSNIFIQKGHEPQCVHFKHGGLSSTKCTIFYCNISMAMLLNQYKIKFSIFKDASNSNLHNA